MLMSSKICNNTSNKSLSHYFSKKTVEFRQRKNLEVRQKKLLLKKYVIKNNGSVIILIASIKTKDDLYQVSNDLGEVKSFYSSFLC